MRLPNSYARFALIWCYLDFFSITKPIKYFMLDATRILLARKSSLWSGSFRSTYIQRSVFNSLFMVNGSMWKRQWNTMRSTKLMFFFFSPLLFCSVTWLCAVKKVNESHSVPMIIFFSPPFYAFALFVGMWQILCFLVLLFCFHFFSFVVFFGIICSHFFVYKMISHYFRHHQHSSHFFLLLRSLCLSSRLWKVVMKLQSD